jgi:hypothetical protein
VSWRHPFHLKIQNEMRTHSQLWVKAKGGPVELGRQARRAERPGGRVSVSVETRDVESTASTRDTYECGMNGKCRSCGALVPLVREECVGREVELPYPRNGMCAPWCNILVI